MREKKDYRIGLDIGITSVGWAAIETDINDEPRRIMDLGVRIFEAAEIPKTGEPLAKPRRDARTTRRRLRRRRHRIERIKILLEQNNWIQIPEFEERYHKEGLPNVYELRYEGLERKLKDDEFAQILIHIAKHRGFKSTRKAEMKDEDNGKVLNATKENQALMEENGYRTVGEMIFKDGKFHVKTPWNLEQSTLAPRNKQDDYRHTILRAMLEDEVKILFSKQREFGNEKATEQVEEDYLNIMLGQRSFDKGPGNQANGQPSPYAGDLIDKMVGKCTLEKEEKRAAKACYTSERFVLLQKINNLTVIDSAGESRRLNPEQREDVLQLIYGQKDVKFAAVRKKLNLSNLYTFKELNYGTGKREEQIKKVEGSAKFFSAQYFHEFKKVFPEMEGAHLETEEVKKLDKIGQILTMYKSDEERTKRLTEMGISQMEIDQLLLLNPSKFQHLSLKAMWNIMPYLEQGFVYSEACEAAGYKFQGEENTEKTEFITGAVLNETLADIPNPVVKRSVSQTVKVLNGIIRKYGSPQAVNIELAREMSKNFAERQTIMKDQEKNRKNNEKVKRDIQETFSVAHPTGQDILKYRLWQDQNGVCIYSGEQIGPEDLFARGEVDIDHIIPYSICFDDSYHNKVLVKSKYNREKGNRLPFEYFGDQEDRWHKYENLVNTYIRDYRKRQLLLKEHFSDEEKEAFKERNLTDTKYITTVVMNLIQKQLKMADYHDQKKKRHVFAVNGSVTSYMRKRWGLMAKDRSTDRHHAMDAAVIACCTNGMIQKISKNVKARELAHTYGIQFVDEETGEIIRRNDFTDEEWNDKFGVQIPKPWINFTRELEIRLSSELDINEDDSSRREACLLELSKIGYSQDELESVRPLFVSRMPKHKVTGAGHADTIRSPRHFEDQGIVLTKTPLANLKLNKENEIDGYYDPDSDRLLYEAIKGQLMLHGNDGAKAFPSGIDFHKPKSDGSEGPVVKKVKTYKRQSLGVLVNGGKGIAENANGSMIRVDVFQENGKYYFVPIYTSDTRKKELPKKAVMQGKAASEWKEMKEENFLFSLYSRDLIKFKSKGGKVVKDNQGETVVINEEVVYYLGADISTGSFNGTRHDSSCDFRGLGIATLEYLKKYQVDVLGNVSEVKKETRMRFK